ncbi:MAG: hypothetical protein GQ574_01350 [Crocinitomix sp.]|nr:hypothetical protein [Crocinitomix sp.]
MSVYKHIIHLVFCFALLAGCHQTKSITPVTDSEIAYITMDNTQVLYRGYDNMLEYGAEGPKGCETYLTVDGGRLKMISSDSLNLAMVKADSSAELTILKLYCACADDTTLLVTKEYLVKTIPHPHIYYGGINLSDYTLYDDTITFDETGIRAKYDHIPGLLYTHALIHECNYTYKNKDYKMIAFPKQIQPTVLREIKVGETIYLNSVKMRYVDGRYVTLYLKREITKMSTIDNNVFVLR